MPVAPFFANVTGERFGGYTRSKCYISKDFCQMYSANGFAGHGRQSCHWHFPAFGSFHVVNVVTLINGVEKFVQSRSVLLRQLSLVALVRLLAPLWLLFPHDAHGRIGERAPQIQERYGKPEDGYQFMAGGLTTATFRFEGFKITVVFLHEVSCSERYQKENLKDFSEQEILILLKANGRGQSWIAAQANDPNMRGWRCLDGDTIATYPKFSLVPELFIISEKLREILLEEQAKREREGLKKF